MKKKIISSLLITCVGLFGVDLSQEVLNEDGSLQIGDENIQINPDLLDGNFYFDLDDINLPAQDRIDTEGEVIDGVKKYGSNEFLEFIEEQPSPIIEPEPEPEPEPNSVVPTPPPATTPPATTPPPPILEPKPKVVTNTVKIYITNVETKVVTKPIIPEPVPRYIKVDVGYEFTRARRMILNREYESALLVLQKIEQVEPHNTRLYNMRGSIYYKLGFYDYSIMNWEKSLQINPRQSLVRRYLNQIRLKPY